MVKLGPPRPVKAKITSPARTLGTEYQNTTGRPLLVIVSVKCSRTSAVGAYGFAVAKIDPTSPPTNAVATGGLYDMDNNAEIVLDTLVFAVPHGYYYKVMALVDALGSTVTLDDWTEVEL